MTINLSKEEYLDIQTLTLASGVTVSAIIDDDSLATANDSSLVTSESVKAYSDAIKLVLTNNSTGWENTETTVNNNSQGWENTETTVNNNSTGWENAESVLNTNSGTWEATNTTLSNNSNGWETAESVLNSNSAGWESTESTLNTNSGTWEAVNTTVSNNSVGWEGTESTVSNNSTDWSTHNATQLQSRDVNSTAPNDTQVLTWVNASTAWVPQDAAGGASYSEYAIVKTGGTPGTDCDYTTIAAAISDGAGAIFIKNGTYTESIITGVDLIGESKDGVIIQQTSGSNPVVTLSDYVKIENLTGLRSGSHTGHIMYIPNGTDNTIINNCIINNTSSGNGNTGIFVFGHSKYNNITNNYFVQSSGGSWDGCIVVEGYSSQKDLNIIGNIFYITGGTSSRVIYFEPGNGASRYCYYINISNNIIHFNTATATKNVIHADSFHAVNSYIQYINITNNNIHVSGGTTDRGIYLDRTGGGTLNAITIVGNIIKADSGQHIVQVNSPTNILDVGNNKLI